MTKPLLGGSAIAIALLSVSLTFTAQTSVAEPLAKTQQESVRPVTGVSVETVSTADAPVINGKSISEADKGTKLTLPVETGSGPAQEASVSGPILPFVATAYCLRGRMANGKQVAKGFIAADSRVLPIGTRVRLDAGNYSGEYVVADTGGAVRGRKIDIWVPSMGEAMRFGRRSIKLTVLTHVRPRTKSRAR